MDYEVILFDFKNQTEPYNIAWDKNIIRGIIYRDCVKKEGKREKRREHKATPTYIPTGNNPSPIMTPKYLGPGNLKVPIVFNNQ